MKRTHIRVYVHERFSGPNSTVATVVPSPLGNESSTFGMVGALDDELRASPDAASPSSAGSGACSWARTWPTTRNTSPPSPSCSPPAATTTGGARSRCRASTGSPSRTTSSSAPSWAARAGSGGRPGTPAQGRQRHDRGRRLPARPLRLHAARRVLAIAS
ncbi:hypothetical protein PR202_ga29192 [Eleusine coracana subsp. coracana]|uniref:Dirigent protein n=1 Tax=Eleusine coracana subsp. coracana TaxID=191504 RepID=A0AAV5DL92_ELECO|nr:hypothetical protein PR202_ga29192 [Eleusine coracana subsp. coracana]